MTLNVSQPVYRSIGDPVVAKQVGCVWRNSRFVITSETVSVCIHGSCAVCQLLISIAQLDFEMASWQFNVGQWPERVAPAEPGERVQRYESVNLF